MSRPQDADAVAAIVAAAPPLSASQASTLRAAGLRRPARGTTPGPIGPGVAHDVSSADGHEGGRHG